eukprot:GHVU01120157.1.p1 GENE.GHVU01120157.1~~GHVU01120157.1.p1  ORF type:complete len:324 (+),score=62.21 GHVU01120157.1:459-1430(+)
MSNMAPSKKVLLMGRAGAGKTSMRSIIFANYLARDTKRLTATNSVEHSHLRFLGSLVLALWDCGGQDSFMQNYFEAQKEHIFRSAEVLIYVIEVRKQIGAEGVLVDDHEGGKDMQYFRAACESLLRLSPRAKLFCLLHKMDLVPDSHKATILKAYTESFENLACGLDMRTFATSIWDETLFRAWSEIVYSLVPNVQMLEAQLQHVCDVCEADEVVLFEKSTFLVISHYTRTPHPDDHRFEKISNICKQFKLTCGKTAANFTSVAIRNPRFYAFVERFTMNTYILLVVSNTDIEPAATLCNLDCAQKHFASIASDMARSQGPAL